MKKMMYNGVLAVVLTSLIGVPSWAMQQPSPAQKDFAEAVKTSFVVLYAVGQQGDLPGIADEGAFFVPLLATFTQLAKAGLQVGQWLMQLEARTVAENLKKGCAPLLPLIKSLELKDEDDIGLQDGLRIFAGAQNLEKLALVGYTQEAYDDAFVGTSLHAFRKLKEVMLQSKLLTTVPTWLLGLTSLQSLDLSYSKLSVLPDGLGRFTQLKKLKCSCNNFIDNSALDVIGKLKELEVLFLEFTSFTHIPESFKQLIKLEKLLFGRNRLDEASFALVCELSHLEMLDLSRDALGGSVAWTTIPATISNLKDLEWLDLSKHALGSAELAKLQALTKLKTLVLEYSQLDDAAAGALARMQQLVSLKLDGNTDFTVAGIQALASIKNLHVLSLYNCNLGDDAVDTLVKLNGLRKLNLGGNKFTPDGIARLRVALQTTKISADNQR